MSIRILMCNDDGVHAPGLAVLAQQFSSEYDVDVVAPETNCSAFSAALTISKPIQVSCIAPHRYSVAGTPADAAHVALAGDWLARPDWVMSGINQGGNLGDDVWYSGTVAAAMEAYFQGIPAIAVSLVGTDVQHYATAARVVARVWSILRHMPLEPLVYNINVPDCPYEQLQGMQVTRLGRRHAAQSVCAQKGPRGDQIYWLGPVGEPRDPLPGTDFYAIQQGYISITPLSFGMTHHAIISELASALAAECDVVAGI